MKNILAIARLSVKMGLGVTFIIFTIVSAFFILSSILYFLMPQLNRFNFQAPAVNATAMGLSSISIFLMFFSIFLSLNVLSRQFAKENVSFFLSKPLKARELLLGSSLGVNLVLLLYWLFLFLEVVIIILVFDKSYIIHATIALLPMVLLIPLYTSLCVLFFSIWPSFLCAIFPFLFIITAFAKADCLRLISYTGMDWLKKLIETSFFFIPPLGQIMAISLKVIGLINVHINLGQVFLNSIFIVILFHILAARRIHKIF